MMATGLAAMGWWMAVAMAAEFQTERVCNWVVQWVRYKDI